MIDLRFRLRIFIGILATIIVLGTLGFKFMERLSLVDAFYFSIVTIATVGYGDIHPSTEPGKFLAMFLILCGVGTFLGVVANATEMIVNRREKQIRLQKTNVVLGTFFSEIGTQLLNTFTAFDQQTGTIGKALKMTGNWPFLHKNPLWRVPDKDVKVNWEEYLHRVHFVTLSSEPRFQIPLSRISRI